MQNSAAERGGGACRTDGGKEVRVPPRQSVSRLRDARRSNTLPLLFPPCTPLATPCTLYAHQVDYVTETINSVNDSVPPLLATGGVSVNVV